VNGKLEHLSAEQLQATVSKHLSGGILTQDLAGLKAAVEAMPWVQSASLRRHWPDRLELAVRERVPLARWGDDSLVTAQGVVFRPDVGGLPAGGLAKLSGRREEALLLVESFQSWGAKLHAIGLQIEELDRDPRGAWMLRLSGGVEVALGTALTEQRLSRFVRSYPRIVAAGTPSLIDMRYSNGLAIRWADPQEEQESADGEKAARAAALIIRPSGPPRS
jgi:cell division protein FtsQ